MSTGQVAAESECPLYPVSQRNELTRQLTLEKDAVVWAKRAGKSSNKSAITRRNLIDEAIFREDGSGWCRIGPLSDDATFLRRVSIDLTGQIPTYDRAVSFFDNSQPRKRTQLIEELLSSSACIDQLALFFANKFQITSGYGAYITPTGRNQFNQRLRDFVAGDLAYDTIAREIIGAIGAANQVGAANFVARGWSGAEPQSADWRQVNYLWGYLFNYGLVDPPDAWDRARLDPKNPPPEPWTLQVTHPELLEQLTDYFIQNDYRIKPVIKAYGQFERLSAIQPA